jgi:hypothetical protein
MKKPHILAPEAISCRCGSARKRTEILFLGVLFTYTARFIGLPLATVCDQALTTVNLNLVGNIVSG